jgi:hypothetical protein
VAAGRFKFGHAGSRQGNTLIVMGEDRATRQRSQDLLRIKRPRQTGPAEAANLGRFLPAGVWEASPEAFIMAVVRVGGSENSMHMTRPVCTYLTVAVSLQICRRVFVCGTRLYTFNARMKETTCFQIRIITWPVGDASPLTRLASFCRETPGFMPTLVSFPIKSGQADDRCRVRQVF